MASILSRLNIIRIPALLLFCVFISGCLSSPLQGPDVERETQYGTVVGKLSGQVMHFIGIPYAKEPIRELRWSAPEAPEPWDEPLATSRAGHACIQGGKPTGVFGAKSEDCLNLNIWAPDTPGRHPVMVWIHGGGFLIGANSESQYNGANLAKQENIVVVSMNYRLSYFGFLAFPPFDTQPFHNVEGNQGLMDQAFALQWIQNNIENFGGDPDNVTLFGQSAGSISTCLLLASPKTTGLFHRVIMQSGACDTFPTQTIAKAQLVGSNFLKAVGCSRYSEPITCARRRAPRNIWGGLGVGGNELLGKYPAEWAFVPAATIGGAFLPDTPMNLIERKVHSANIEMIIGTTVNEASLFLGAKAMPEDEEQYLALLADYYPADPQKVSRWYPLDDFTNSGEAVSQIVTDVAFTCAAKRMADLWSRGNDVYLYQFSQPVSAPLMEFLTIGWRDNAPDLGIFHTAEIPYVFATSGIPGDFVTEEQLHVKSVVSRYWGSFARTGNPTSPGNTPDWPRYIASEQLYMDINSKFTPGVGLRRSYCNFWEGKSISFF